MYYKNIRIKLMFEDDKFKFIDVNLSDTFAEIKKNVEIKKNGEIQENTSIFLFYRNMLLLDESTIDDILIKEDETIQVMKYNIKIPILTSKGIYLGALESNHSNFNNFNSLNSSNASNFSNTKKIIELVLPNLILIIPSYILGNAFITGMLSSTYLFKENKSFGEIGSNFGENLINGMYKSLSKDNYKMVYNISNTLFYKIWKYIFSFNY